MPSKQGKSKSAKKRRDVDDEVVEEIKRAQKKRPKAPPRLSIVVEPKLRKAIRIAAARADLEIGDWCKAVLSAAARKTVERLYGEEDE